MYLITVLEKRLVTICIVPGGQLTRGGNASAATATAGFPRSSNQQLARCAALQNFDAARDPQEAGSAQWQRRRRSVGSNITWSDAGR